MTGANESAKSSHGVLGSVCLLSGIILLALRGLEMMHSLPGMPRFWHNQDAVWLAIGLACVAFGAWVLSSMASTKVESSWRPQRTGRRFKKLVLYSRADCPLCEEARDVLIRHRRWLPDVLEIDIDQDARLVESFGTCIPVVSFDGKVRFRGKVSTILLRRLIDGTPPNESVA